MNHTCNWVTVSKLNGLKLSRCDKGTCLEESRTSFWDPSWDYKKSDAENEKIRPLFSEFSDRYFAQDVPESFTYTSPLPLNLYINDPSDQERSTYQDCSFCRSQSNPLFGWDEMPAVRCCARCLECILGELWQTG